MQKPIDIHPQFRRELSSWSLIAFAMAAFEGGVAGVLINHIFKGQVSIFWLSQAIAIVAGAPAFANLSSPFWARLEHGRNKVKLVSMLMMGCSSSLLLFVFASDNSLGLWLVVSASLIGRICWSGVVTTRSALWRANFPRYIRAKITASFALPMSLILASTGVLIGWLSEHSLFYVKMLYLALFIVGVAGAVVYSSLQLRGAKKLSEDEIQIRKKEEGH